MKTSLDTENNLENNEAKLEEKNTNAWNIQVNQNVIPTTITSQTLVPSSYRAIAKEQIAITLSDALNSFVTGVMLGNISDDALAAGPLISSINLILFVATMAPLHASAILIREAKGANQLQNIPILWRQSLIIATFLSPGPIVMMKFGIKPILSVLNQKPEIISIVQDYYDAYAWSVLPNALENCYEEFAFGIDKTNLVIAVRFLGLTIFSGVGYGLTFGKFGAPALNAAGIAYAGLIQTVMTLLIFISISKFKKDIEEYKLLNHLFIRTTDQLKRLWTIGWPMLFSALNELSAEFVVTIFSGTLGDSALAAREISGTYSNIILEPLFALARGSSLLVGENIGKKRIGDARRIGDVGILLGFTVCTTGLILSCVIPKQLAGVFINVDDPNNADVVNMINPVLSLTATVQLIDSVRTISSGALSGLPDTFIPTVLSTLSTWVLSVPLGYLMGNYTNLGINGLLIGQGIGMAIGSSALYYRWHNECQKPEKYLQQANTEEKPSNSDSEKSTTGINGFYRRLKNYSSRFFASSGPREPLLPSICPQTQRSPRQTYGSGD
jgi:MATE family multidrug resistance protein